MSTNFLPPSELVLNPDGSIYHLNLLPEQIADTIFFVGDQYRVAEISKYFDRVEVEVKKREFVTHTGYLGKKRLSVISTGIGGDNIDIVLNELDALVNIDLASRTIKSDLKRLTIIRIGTSGAVQEDIKCDSFVVSSGGLGIDGTLNFFKKNNTPDEQNILSHFEQNWDKSVGVTPYFTFGDSGLIDALRKDMVKGITATCGGFYAAQGRRLRLATQVPNIGEVLRGFKYANHRITNFEMETAAIYGLAKLLGHRAISFNAILANRVDNTFSATPYNTIEKLIKTVLERVENL